MPGRILGGSCGNVRLFSVPPPPLLSFSFSLPCSFSLSFFHRPPLPSPRVLLLLSLFREPVFFLHLGRLDDSFLPRVHLPSPFSAPFARSSSSSRLPAFGYHLGHRGHPPRCTRYVVCPIFTHGKSTLKRRWTPALLSSLLQAPPLLSPSILRYGCFSISADRVKIGSQRPRRRESSLRRRARSS